MVAWIVEWMDLSDKEKKKKKKSSNSIMLKEGKEVNDLEFHESTGKKIDTVFVWLIWNLDLDKSELLMTSV